MSLQQTMKALSDPTRRQILTLLRQGSLSAGEIGEHFDMSGAAVSKHLSLLKEAELVRDRREGKHIYYELNASVLEEVLLWLRELKGERDEAEEVEAGRGDIAAAHSGNHGGVPDLSPGYHPGPL